MENGVVTYSVYDGWNVAAEYDSNGTMTNRWTYAGGDLFRRIGTEYGTVYYYPDASGSTRYLAGPTGNILEQRLAEEALAVARWREIDLALEPKGHPLKVEIARQLREQTPMSRRWIAEPLRMGSASYVSNLLASVDSKL